MSFAHGRPLRDCAACTALMTVCATTSAASSLNRLTPARISPSEVRIPFGVL
jgi:hypothetical protein